MNKNNKNETQQNKIQYLFYLSIFRPVCHYVLEGWQHVQGVVGFSIITHTHSHLTALFPGLPRWAGTRTVKPIWILLKQEAVSGSGISWAICKSAFCSRQITIPAPHPVFYGPDAFPAAQPTASKHWRQILNNQFTVNLLRNQPVKEVWKSVKIWVWYLLSGTLCTSIKYLVAG